MIESSYCDSERLRAQTVTPVGDAFIKHYEQKKTLRTLALRNLLKRCKNLKPSYYFTKFEQLEING